jgi:Leucine-rich repeat (LRR) protein
MAFRTPVFYGFRVDSNLSDVINKNRALENILIDINDLDVIRGVASEEGATRFDLQAISRLKEDVYRTLDRFQGDTGQYEGILRESPGADIALRGNINVRGGVGGSAVRFRKVNDTNDGIDFRDISTSRVSSWSTTTSPGSPSDPIYYGGEVLVADGGQISVSKVTFGDVAQPRRFDSEIPTHKVTLTINGQEVEAYAMKSIPIRFRGFFRRFNAEISFTNINNLRASWRIVNVNDPADIESYANLGQLTGTTLNFRSIRSAERDIEFYYPPDNVTSISLPNVTLRELPEASLPNLTSVNFSFNDIKDMPDFVKFSPNLVSLNIRNNPLYLSGNEDLRKLNASVMARIPTSVTSLNMTSTFFGSVRTTGTPGSSPSVIEDRLPNLRSLSLRGGFSRDDFDTSAFLPTVPDSCEDYSVGNDFRNIPSTGVTDVSSLQNFSVSGNEFLSDSGFETSGFPNAAGLRSLNISGTNLRIPTLQNKEQLESISATFVPSNTFYLNDAQESTYKLLNCSSLESIQIQRSGVGGFIPKFKGNTSFRSFDAWPGSSLTGGRPDNGEHGYSDGTTFVMYKDTFADCRGTIQDFFVQSSNILPETDFEEGTFSNLSSLRRLYWQSFGRTGGTRNDIFVPDISSCPSLEFLNMPENNFSGPAPSFITNDNIRYVNLSRNKLTGPVPEYTNRLRLYYINLRNNQLTSFPGFASLPALEYIYLQNNSTMTGTIPDITESASNVRRVYLFNCAFDRYTAGSFAGLTRIDRIFIANNDLSESDLNNIITDLHTLYQNNGMSRVQIDLRGQSNAPNYNPRSEGDGGSQVEDTIRTFINTLREAGNWTIIGVDG